MMWPVAGVGPSAAATRLSGNSAGGDCNSLHSAGTAMGCVAIYTRLKGTNAAVSRFLFFVLFLVVFALVRQAAK